jgi:hypothetical protein
MKQINPNLERSLESHLIGPQTLFGITNNDFKKFLEARAEMIVNELQKLAAI